MHKVLCIRLSFCIVIQILYDLIYYCLLYFFEKSLLIFPNMFIDSPCVSVSVVILFIIHFVKYILIEIDVYYWIVCYRVYIL